ncbi:MAG: flippase [Firmicutes bacterium]|nr:flippase [Bacillota bacterium]
MKTSRRVIKNFLSLSATEAVTRLFGTILSIYIARTLGAGALGQLAFAAAFCSYFILFADFGLNALGIREIAKDKSKTGSYGTNILVIQTVLAFLLVILLGLIVSALPLDTRIKWITFLFGLAIIPAALNMSYIFQAHEKMEYLAVSSIISQVGYVLFGIVLLYTFKDIIVLPVVNLLTAFIGTAIAFHLLRNQIKFVWDRVNLTQIKILAKNSLPFLISALALQVYYNFDKVMLQFTAGSETVGYYSVSYKLMLLIVSVMGLYYSSIYPLMSSFAGNKEFEKLDKLVLYTQKIIAVMAVPLVIGGIFLAKEVIVIIFGAQYYPSVFQFQILLINPMVIWIVYIFSYLLITNNLMKDYIFTVAAGAIFNIIANLIFIPLFGMTAASITTVATELVVLTASLYCFYKKHHPDIVMPKLVLNLYLKPIIASALMFALLYILRDILNLKNAFFLLGTGTLSYIIFSLAIGSIKYGEIKEFIQNNLKG